MMTEAKNKLFKQGIAKIKRAQKKKFAVSDKHYFSLKGKAAEETLCFLAQKTFLADWCYLNPILPDGKELCDLLVVFGATAIIWQLKDVKLKDSHIKISDYDKNIRQISGAFRRLSNLKIPVELNNPIRGKEEFDASKIGNYFLISAFFGDSPLTLKATEKVKDKYIHVFNRDFTEIVLNELDTISDFTKYLEEKETFFKSKKSSIIIVGGEKELLGHYLLNEKSFDKLKSGNYTSIMIDADAWQDLISRKEYKAKVRANEISYFWDYLIGICHTGDNSEYEFIARELARLNRFERRNMAMAFIELHKIADKGDYELSYRRTIESDNIPFCFLCHGDSDDDKSRENRKKQLGVFCHIARGQHQNNSKVIGIATDQKIKSQTAYDFCLIDIPIWTEEDQKIMEMNMKDTGILTKPIKHYEHFVEYPQV